MIFRNPSAVNQSKEHRARRLGSDLPLQTVLSLFLLAPHVPATSAQDKESADAYVNAPSAVLYKPGARRDPFLNITGETSDKTEPQDNEISRGTPPPGIAGTLIAEAGLEGIVTRSGNRRTVIIRSADNRAYFLRKGDRLFDGYIQTIGNDFVIFVRETSMRSGKTVTEEITRRLRKS